jgi:glycosyltransferase involved in cell wall biosynthesis
VEVTFYPTNGLNTYAGYGRLEAGLASGLEAAGVTVSVAPKRGRVVLAVGYPRWLEAPHVRNERRWLLTMSESTLVSEAWVDAINANAERVLVPCAQLVDVYRNSGVTVPVHDVGCGVSGEDAIGLDGLAPVEYRADRDPFTFLAYSYGEMRKNADNVVQQFLVQFHGDTRYKLVVKARENFAVSWMSTFKHPQVEFVTGVQGEDDWADLIRSAHCFVFPSRGEGFGLPPREATLLHIPSIATRWLGLADVDCWGVPVEVERMHVATFETWQANREGAQWAFPSPEQIGTQMRWVAEHYEEAYALAVRGADYLRRESSWEAMGRRVAALIEAYS